MKINPENFIPFDVDEYQEWTKTTAVYPPEKALDYLTLGLNSESGEIAGKVKKIIRDETDLSLEIISEIGDCLWYIAQLASFFGIPLSKVFEENRKKLEKRKLENKIHGSGDNR